MVEQYFASRLLPHLCEPNLYCRKASRREIADTPLKNNALDAEPSDKNDN